jgi:regulator of RNase E activity RraA
MSEETFALELLDELRKYDTPTICNALEVLLGGRRITGFTTEPFVCADPKLPPLVGYARTATLRAAEPALLSPKEARDQRMKYYEYIAAEPHPTVVVIQDIDARPGLGAWWGEVHALVHQKLGSLGVVTNGAIRDLDFIAPGFQLLGGKISPSHAFVHIVDVGVEVNVFGLTVRHHDLIHADRHGAVVIPAHLAARMPHAIQVMIQREQLIMAAARQPGFSVEDIRRAMDKGDDIH